MEIQPQSSSSTACPHCGREIPTPNVDLHFLHCSRNLERCTLCGEMIPKKHAGEHYDSNHAPVDCSLCSGTMQREVLEYHKGVECPQRIVTCEYCEFPLPAVDLSEHQEVCGNRTEYCDACNKYVRLRERINHDMRFHSSPNGPPESSRNGNIHGREERNRPGNDGSKGRLLLTIAITGIAVLLGSIFFQKRTDAQQQQ